mmetsp:Transcript_23610/g.58343  ORF Transcript_23610/g.58343 Transcript_23610/m.58343 type:complete len:232 (-) Transcript_23610:192-887(-)|eukprot:CAMPEP_0206248960 /NCGR_PEP_ID=MMETSP0047_2-20121206/20653_1 /ASSEMBLY_ACC=CAM_ASM_000192 /TAXON_ID=195065 /ORGANISM="Chroomonas mesostigmatica_cf, Strain CCMP1168" /LENGTH=231 /DNA_ID=CAMNT_0053674649 /DNA_START=46 /DNA_END=741 /DNA_ORIENTATION=+
MTINKNQTMDGHSGHENLTTQVHWNKVHELGNKLQDLKDQAVGSFKKEEKPPEPKTAGQHLDTAVESTKSKAEAAREAVSEKVHDTIVEPAGDKMAQAGDKLKEQSEAVAPPPKEEKKSVMETVKDKIEEAKTEVREGFWEGYNNVTKGKDVKKEEEEAPKTLGSKIDGAIDGVTSKVADARESAQASVNEAKETTDQRVEESKQKVADHLSKAGDVLKDAGDKAHHGDMK